VSCKEEIPPSRRLAIEIPTPEKRRKAVRTAIQSAVTVKLFCEEMQGLFRGEWGNSVRSSK
jgi:hypothetical protein